MFISVNNAIWCSNSETEDALNELYAKNDVSEADVSFFWKAKIDEWGPHLTVTSKPFQHILETIERMNICELDFVVYCGLWATLVAFKNSEDAVAFRIYHG